MQAIAKDDLKYPGSIYSFMPGDLRSEKGFDDMGRRRTAASDREQSQGGSVCVSGVLFGLGSENTVSIEVYLSELQVSVA